MRTHRIATTVLVTSIMLWTAAVPSGATERVALVIGNTACAHVPALANPQNDLLPGC